MRSYIYPMSKNSYFTLLSSGLVVFGLLLIFDVIAGQTLISNLIKSVTIVTSFIAVMGIVIKGEGNRHIEYSYQEADDLKQVQDQDQEQVEVIEEEKEPVVIEQVVEVEKVTPVKQIATDIVKEPVTEPVMEQIKEPVVLVETVEKEVEQKVETQGSALERTRTELLSHENKTRGAKQKEFFSHQNTDTDREYLGVNISEIVGLSEKMAPELSEKDILALLKSTVHDERILAVWMMINQYKNIEMGGKKAICDFYMAHRSYIDNWDMTDLAARNVLGSYVHEFGHEELITELIAGESAWDKRSAVMATHPSVIAGNIDLGFFVSEKLIDENEELIQSAIGWVLKEAYKQNEQKTEQFIKDHFHSLSKQAIRIGTERMDKEYRKAFLRGDFKYSQAR